MYIFKPKPGRFSLFSLAAVLLLLCALPACGRGGKKAWEGQPPATAAGYKDLAADKDSDKDSDKASGKTQAALPSDSGEAADAPETSEGAEASEAAEVSEAAASEKDEKAGGESGEKLFNDPSWIGSQGVRGPLPTEDTLYDVGKFTVLVPAGWAGFERFDGDGKKLDDICDLAKGTTDGMKIYDVPNVMIACFEDGGYMSYPEGMVDKKEDVPSLEINGYKWEGFKGIMWDKPMMAYTAAKENHSFNVQFTLEGEGESIPEDDPVIQQILGALTYTGK